MGLKTNVFQTDEFSCEPNTMDKSYEERVKEVINVLRQLQDYGVAPDTAGYDELKSRMTDYIKTGDPWLGRIPLPEINKVAHLLLPRRARDAIQLTLKHM